MNPQNAPFSVTFETLRQIALNFKGKDMPQTILVPMADYIQIDSLAETVSKPGHFFGMALHPCEFLGVGEYLSFTSDLTAQDFLSAVDALKKYGKPGQARAFVKGVITMANQMRGENGEKK